MLLDDSDGALESWARFCALSGELVGGAGDLSVGPRLAPVVADLCARGLATLVRDYFLHNLEVCDSRSSLSPSHSSLYCSVLLLASRTGWELGMHIALRAGCLRECLCRIAEGAVWEYGVEIKAPRVCLCKCPCEIPSAISVGMRDLGLGQSALGFWMN